MMLRREEGVGRRAMSIRRYIQLRVRGAVECPLIRINEVYDQQQNSRSLPVPI